MCGGIQTDKEVEERRREHPEWYRHGYNHFTPPFDLAEYIRNKQMELAQRTPKRRNYISRIFSKGFGGLTGWIDNLLESTVPGVM